MDPTQVRIRAMKEAFKVAISAVWGDEIASHIEISTFDNQTFITFYYSDPEFLWVLFLRKDRFVFHLNQDTHAHECSEQGKHSDCEFAAHCVKLIVDEVIDEAMINFIGG